MALSIVMAFIGINFSVPGVSILACLVQAMFYLHQIEAKSSLYIGCHCHDGNLQRIGFANIHTPLLDILLASHRDLTAAIHHL